MTLEEAIQHAEEHEASCIDCQCSWEHRQLAAWLRELETWRAEAPSWLAYLGHADLALQKLTTGNLAHGVGGVRHTILLTAGDIEKICSGSGNPS